jgi:hypothetical protein
MKSVLCALVLSSSLLAGPAHAENGENAAIIGSIIGGIIGGAVGGHGPFPDRPFPHRPFPGRWPRPGWPHRPFPGPVEPGPGPGPGPGPVFNADLCTGTYTDNGSTALSLAPQPNGQTVFSLNGMNGYYAGVGACYATGPGTAQFQFSLVFNGVAHNNAGQIILGADGRAYLQGNQDTGPMYTFVR